MATRKTVRFDDISKGRSPTAFAYPKGTFMASLAVDPDAQSAMNVRTSGVIRPVPYAKFSGTEVTGAPLWITANPRTQNSFVFASDGKLHSYDRDLAMRATDEASTAFPISVAASGGNGMAFYDNYLYLGQNANIARYGPFDSAHVASIALDASWWTDIGKTALIDSTYPSLRGVEMPNHVMHVHGDGALYVGDVLPSGQGCLHRIETAPQLDYDGQTGNFTVGLVVTGGTSGATAVILADSDAGATGTLTLGSVLGTFQNNEALSDTSTGAATVNGTLTPGAGDSGNSEFEALDLPSSYFPTAIETWGSDLVIAASQTSGGTNQNVWQGPAALFFWDGVSPSFYRQIDVQDPMVTALKTVNGTLWVFSGNASSGCRVSKYNGGEELEQTEFIEDGLSPQPGAVDSIGSRVTWGGYVTFPTTVAVVFARGSKLGADMGLHCVAKSSSGDATPTVTAVRYTQQADGKTPRFVMGWAGTTSGNYGLDKYSQTSISFAQIYLPYVSVGRKFRVLRVEVEFEKAMESGVSVVGNVYYDSLSNSDTMTTLNNTNYSGKTRVVQKYPEISVVGGDGFSVQFEFQSTVQTGIKAVEVEYETFDNDISS